MLNPIRLVNDLFDDKELSDADLRSFAEDHLVRLSQPENNPGGIYSVLITDTTTKYTAYYGKITSEAAKKAIAEGTTATRNQERKVTEEKISQLQGLVKYKFGETSGIYQEFYPLGMDEYYQAREGEIGTKFDRFVIAAGIHLAAEYPAEVSAITSMVTGFHNAYTARETAMAQVDAVGTGKHADRKALTIQLTFNFLTIATNNIGNPDRFDDYYNPEYLPISDSLRTFSGIINFNSIITAVEAGIITGSSDLLIENKGTVDLVFSLNDVPGVIHPASEMTIVPGQRHRFTETLPVFTQYYLNIQNPSPDQNGSWHVEVS